MAANPHFKNGCHWFVESYRHHSPQWYFCESHTHTITCNGNYLQWKWVGKEELMFDHNQVLPDIITINAIYENHAHIISGNEICVNHGTHHSRQWNFCESRKDHSLQWMVFSKKFPLTKYAYSQKYHWWEWCLHDSLQFHCWECLSRIHRKCIIPVSRDSVQQCPWFATCSIR